MPYAQQDHTATQDSVRCLNYINFGNWSTNNSVRHRWKIGSSNCCIDTLILATLLVVSKNKPATSETWPSEDKDHDDSSPTHEVSSCRSDSRRRSCHLRQHTQPFLSSRLLNTSPNTVQCTSTSSSYSWYNHCSTVVHMGWGATTQSGPLQQGLYLSWVGVLCPAWNDWPVKSRKQLGVNYVCNGSALQCSTTVRAYFSSENWNAQDHRPSD